MLKVLLAAVQLGHLWDRIGVVAALDASGLKAVLETALLERAAVSAPHIELVWTGEHGGFHQRHAHTGMPRKWMVLRYVKSSIIQRGLSRPMPESLMPPNGT